MVIREPRFTQTPRTVSVHTNGAVKSGRRIGSHDIVVDDAHRLRTAEPRHKDANKDDSHEGGHPTPDRTLRKHDGQPKTGNAASGAEPGVKTVDKYNRDGQRYDVTHHEEH